MNKIKILGKLRNYILSVELMGFLHDIGKLDERLYKEHTKRYEEDVKSGNVPNTLSDFFSKPLDEIFNKDVPNWLKGVRIEGFQNHDERHPFTNLIEKIISIADNQDSWEDRGAHEERDVGFGEAFIATPFGYEEKLSNYLDERIQILKMNSINNPLSSARMELYKRLSKLIDQLAEQKRFDFKLREKILTLINNFFSLSLAETRRPSNDVKLVDHAYMVGSIAKSILVGCILDEGFREKVEGMNVSEKDRFKLLVVGFDGYGFITKVNRLPDFIGRFEKFDEMRRKVREIVEFEIPVGNLIYWDLNVMCFLIPDLTSIDNGNEIISKLRKRIVSTVISETNGLVVPLVKVCGRGNGEASKYIGPLIENAKKISAENVNFPYYIDQEEVKELPWVKDWEKSWMWKCNDCNENGVSTAEFDKCPNPKCGSNKLKQKPREKCYVCGYAPEYPIPEGDVSTRGERLCKYCYEVRLNGVVRRLAGEEKETANTVWLDQIRDEKPSSRIALIVGKIWPAEKWLSGEYVKETTGTIYGTNPETYRNDNETFWKRNNVELLEYYIKLRDWWKGLTKENFQNKILELDEILRKLGKLIKRKPKVIEDIKFEETSVIDDLFKLKRKLQSIQEDVRLAEEREKYLQRVKYLMNRIYERLAINAEAEKFISELKQYSEDAKIELCKILSKKPASPSRLRRVWKEFEEFSDKSIEIAKEFFEDKKRKQLILKIDKELKERTLGKSELGTVISGKKGIITIDYLDCIKNDEKLNELSEEKIRKLLLGEEIEVEWEDSRKEKYKIENIEFRYFIPIVSIYSTAGEFMLLCPAKYALALITRIKVYFFNRFSKALGKLSLNLGLICFKYKQPLYLVLDAGRRLLKEFENKVLRERDEKKSYEIKRNGDIFIIDELKWNVVPKFDDGSEDWYYCTVKEHTGGYKPMLGINGGKIKVYHNFFDYEYIESAQKRFDIILGKPMLEGGIKTLAEEMGLLLELSKRSHSILKKVGPRPYLLEELGRIIKLWEILNPENGKFTKSLIMKIMHICSDKIEEWKENGLVKDFIKSTVENMRIKLRNEEKEFLIESITDGSFFDTIELFIKLEQELSPFDVILFFVDFQYNKEERIRAEKSLLLQGGSDANP